MSDHIGDAAEKVDLDALEKRLTAGSKQTITRYFGDLSGAIVDHDLLREAAAAVAELKEARGLLKEILESDKDWLVLAPDQSVRVSAFLARNGKGEG